MSLLSPTESGHALTPKERKKISLLVIESDPDTRQILRTCLQKLGYGSAYFVADHHAGEKVLAERPFTHIIFESKTTTMPPDAFLIKALTYDRKIVALASSSSPAIDDVFELLRIGARGFLAKPISMESVDMALIMATKGERFSETILNSKNRNEAFAALTAATLDKAATALRQSKDFATARRDYPHFMGDLRNSVRLGSTFAKGGEEQFLEDLVDFFVALASGPASRLGRLRKRLRKQRGSAEGEAQ
ncbi:MAG: response regulator [Bdellovibrionales bacterium]|nr:response regulator [Bdellovibrionales bacterium]